MKLKLPPTLAFPAAEDCPKGYDLEALDAARAAARIEPGYVLSVPREPRPFTFYARCNLDRDRLWAAFEAFVGDLPEVVGALIGFKDEKPKSLPYALREEIMSTLRLYRRELSTDPFLECGLIDQREGRTHEVFITAAKYLRVWGNDVALFKRTASTLGLDEIPELRFIDEFPLTSHALSHVEPGALRFMEVLEDICDRLDPGERAPASE